MNKMFVVSEKKEINTAEKSVVAWANRPVVDRDGELVAHDCEWIMDSFKKNPVLLMGHNYSIPSAGRVLWWKQTPDGMKFKAQFANTPMGNELWELYKSNMMNAFSIGFIPKAWEDHETTDSKMPRRTYKSIELLEISCVTVPSCSAAVIDAEEKGLIKTKDLSDVINQIKMIKSQELSNGESEIQSQEKGQEAQAKEADSRTNSSAQEEEIVFEFELEEDTVSKSEDNFCTCEDSEYENDTCKACGGKRKPKKEVKAPQCQCSECDATCAPEDGKCDMNCPECGASMSMSDDNDEDDVEQDACKPKKPKKDINVTNVEELGYTISDEEVENLVQQFEKMLSEPVVIEKSIDEPTVSELLSLVESMNSVIENLKSEIKELKNPVVEVKDVEAEQAKKLADLIDNELANKIKSGDSKLIEIVKTQKTSDNVIDDHEEITSWEIDFDQKETKELEDEFDYNKALSIVEKSLDKVLNTKFIDVDDLVYESLMKAKGKMFY